MAAIKPSSKTFYVSKIYQLCWKNQMKWKLLSWVITCTRKRGRLLLGKNWIQRCNQIMLRTNMLLQFSRRKDESHCSSSSQKVWKVYKDYFLLSESIIVHGKAVNQNDGLGMKVPSRLLFTAEEKFINILKESCPKLL